MAYSTNPETLRAWLPYLGELAEGRTCRWKLKEPRAAWFAYKTREALAIAKQLAQITMPYSDDDEGLEFLNKAIALSEMASTVKIEVLSPTEVQAVLALQPPEAEVLAGATPIQGLEVEGQRSQQEIGHHSAEEIIKAWKERQPSNAPMFFPGANLTLVEMLKLHAWAKAQHWLILEADGAITLRRKQAGLEEFAWNPPEAING